MDKTDTSGIKKITCKNCNLNFKGFFCPRCGQNHGVKRFNFKYFLKESFISSLDIENGFFPTIRALSTRPGSSIRNYLLGKRLSLTVPMRYLLVMGALAAFVTIKYKIFEGTDSGAPFPFLNFMDKAFWDYATEFLTILNIITVPIFALFSYLFFKSKGFNYSENLIINMYITGHQLFILLIFFPIIELLLPYKSIILYIYSGITLIYNFWAFQSFFRLYNICGVLRTISALVAAYIVQLCFNYGIFKIFKLYDIIPHLQKIDF